MSDLERAIAIAVEAHAGQRDKSGAPYVLHPLRVMLSLPSNDERIVAVLHDVCEDCPGWTFERLRAEGFSERILTALNSVTKRDGEAYEDFVRRAADNPIGRAVKLADMEDNCDLSRISSPTERDFARIEKYKKAIDLIAHLPAPQA
jgi:(p)ppGpp synthase/HD superfamily hydrolase